MGFPAKVLNVMIASPSDVQTERAIVTEEIHSWNSAHAAARQWILLPIKWETNSSPELGAHPQDILNKQLLNDADILVGIFATRIGTPTAEFASGTVEEITRHAAAGKRAMVYFSRVPVDQNSVDQDQLNRVLAFKEKIGTRCLYAEFHSHEALRTSFRQHLQITLNRHEYRAKVKHPTDSAPNPTLSPEAKRLLLAAESDRNGQILALTDMAGLHVQANGESPMEADPRSEALWKSALRKLEQLGYIARESDTTFKLTDEGYARADQEKALAPLHLSLSVTGQPGEQSLSVESSKPITITQTDFLTTADVCEAGAQQNTKIDKQGTIPIGQSEIVKLFNAPRPDKQQNTFAGPAKLKVVFHSAGGETKEVILPVNLEPAFVRNAVTPTLTGSKEFIVK